MGTQWDDETVKAIELLGLRAKGIDICATCYSFPCECVPGLRHLSGTERDMIRRIVDHAGLPDVLRCIAGIVGNDIEDAAVAGKLKSSILRVASEIQGGNRMEK